MEARDAVFGDLRHAKRPIQRGYHEAYHDVLLVVRNLHCNYISVVAIFADLGTFHRKRISTELGLGLTEGI